MSDVSDDSLIRMFKPSSVVISGGVTVLDMFFLTDVHDLSGYIFLRYWTTPSWTAKFGYAMSILITCLFILVLYIQTRIEKDRAHFQEEVFYKISTIRWLVIIFFINLPLFIGHILYPHIFDLRYSSACGYLIVTGVCPCIFISSHQGIIDLWKSSLSNKKVQLLNLVSPPEAPYSI